VLRYTSRATITCNVLYDDGVIANKVAQSLRTILYYSCSTTIIIIVEIESRVIPDVTITIVITKIFRL
jgi:hypothetical protein